MILAVAFMTIAAVRAQTAYMHRHDGPLVAQPFIGSAIRMAAMGTACFLTAKVLT